jgi:F420H(2)-dependent quinone reductase
MSVRQWLYRGGRPGRVASVLNRLSAKLHASGVAPDYLVTLEVTARKSGRLTSVPLVMVVVSGERYLVSMLGEPANWVQNVRAAHGAVTIHHGRREHVHLEEVDAPLRAPVLKAFLQCAPGARPHIAVDKDAPLHEFENIAHQYPVFRVTH